MFCVYFYFNKENELIYVGKTVDVYRRWQQHQEEWITQVEKIGIREYSAKANMDIMEHYYITKLEPKYNIALTTNGATTLELIDESKLITYELNEFVLKFRPKSQQQKPIIAIEEQLVEMGNTIISFDDGIINLFDEKILCLDLDRTIFKYNDFYLISQYTSIPEKYINNNEIDLSYRTNAEIKALFQVLNNPSLKTCKDEFGANSISISVQKCNIDRLQKEMELAFNCSRLYGLYYKSSNSLYRGSYNYNIFSSVTIRNITQSDNYKCTLSFTDFYFKFTEFLEIDKNRFKFNLNNIDILN